MTAVSTVGTTAQWTTVARTGDCTPSVAEGDRPRVAADRPHRVRSWCTCTLDPGPCLGGSCSRWICTRRRIRRRMTPNQCITPPRVPYAGRRWARGCRSPGWWRVRSRRWGWCSKSSPLGSCSQRWSESSAWRGRSLGCMLCTSSQRWRLVNPARSTPRSSTWAPERPGGLETALAKSHTPYTASECWPAGSSSSTSPRSGSPSRWCSLQWTLSPATSASRCWLPPRWGRAGSRTFPRSPGHRSPWFQEPEEWGLVSTVRFCIPLEWELIGVHLFPASALSLRGGRERRGWLLWNHIPPASVCVWFCVTGEEEEELVAMLMFAQQALFSGRDPVKWGNAAEGVTEQPDTAKHTIALGCCQCLTPLVLWLIKLLSDMFRRTFFLTQLMA